MRYAETAADRTPLPGSYDTEHRHLGYDAAEHDLPYADFFRVSPRTLTEHATAALVAGPAPSELGYGVDEVVDRLERPGHEALETGWTRQTFVAVRTPMPTVTAAMWDWWFGWHSRESARYKLWHPTAHQFAALGEDRGRRTGLTDRQKYVDNVSYVDEYIGSELHRLAIRFLAPERMGFTHRPGTLHVCARVTLSQWPIAIGWLVHQVRPTPDGVEMRSRFFLGDLASLDLPRRTRRDALVRNPVVRQGIERLPGPAVVRVLPSSIGADMVHHCATEMNHLAGFLPALHERCRDEP